MNHEYITKCPPWALSQAERETATPLTDDCTNNCACVALSWGQPTWQGLGFSGPVHEETHPCGPNCTQSIFEPVWAMYINSVLIHRFHLTGFEKKIYFLIPVLNLTLQIFLLWHVNLYHYHQAWIKPLYLSWTVGLTTFSIRLTVSVSVLQNVIKIKRLR